jgi:thiamine biosynthesis lipoprotein
MARSPEFFALKFRPIRRKNVTLAASFLLWLTGTTLMGQPQRFERRQPHMGTQFEIILYADSAEQADRAFSAAFNRIDELDRMLSSFQPGSEVNRIVQDAPHHEFVPIRAELFTVLAEAEKLHRISGGAFDVTIGPLSRLWRRARREHTLPSADALAAARASVGFPLMQLNHKAKSVRLTRAGMHIDLGGIAKGYAADEALRLIREAGIESGLVNGGGDISVSGPPPGRVGWTLAINTTHDSDAGIVLALANRAVATSGDLFQFVEIDGVRYSHLIDPATGLGVTHCAQATVIARHGILADGLASAVSVLDEKRALEMIATLPDVEARRTARVHDELHTVATAGFGRYVIDPIVEPAK